MRSAWLHLTGPKSIWFKSTRQPIVRRRKTTMTRTQIALIPMTTLLLLSGTAASGLAAPRPADDLTGAMGFGVGVIPGSDSLIKPDTSVLTFKYWRSDAVAWMPQVRLSLHKANDQPLAWSVEPAMLVSFTLLKGASTRLSVAGGLGLGLGKNQDPATAVNSHTHWGIFLPFQVGVEHFFASWFAMGISARFDFLNLWKQGDRWELNMEVSSTEYLGSLFFYTD
jgi:hypothetical protein